MRVFCGGILTETNTFSPLPVGIAAFERHGIRRGNYVADASHWSTVVTWAAQQRAAAENWTVITGLLADAEPGAAVVRRAYEALRDELLEGVRAAMPLDAVALNLHGGMVAEGYDDCEGDLITRVRDIVGPHAVIGALFDPHSHLSSEMLAGTTLPVFYKENPHTDITERAVQLVDLMARTLRGEIKPVVSAYDCRMMDVFQTNCEPMRTFVNEIRAMEGRDGVLDISIVHGFRRADIPIVGAWVIVITNDLRSRGDGLARELGQRLIAMRGQAFAPHVPLEDALRRVHKASRWPVLLADLADNPGGGSPGDSTYIVDALLAQGVRSIVAGILWDPLAVRIAFEAGEGAVLPMRIGGKACALSGRPLDLVVRVGRLLPEALQLCEGTRIRMGRVAALHAEAVTFLVAEVRTQTYAPNLFLEAGIDLSTATVIVVKSAQHYRSRFLDHFAEDVVVDAPGVCAADIERLPFTRIRRPIWPFDPNPWQEST